jgi:hypothetical protein
MRQLIILIISFVFVINISAQDKKLKKNFSQPIAGGLIKLDRSYFHYPNITTKDIKEDVVTYRNYTEKDIEIVLKKLPDHISVQIIPEIVKPNTEGLIKVRYDASKRINKNGDYVLGKEYMRIPIYIKGQETKRDARRDYITIRTFVQEDFSHLTKHELKRAPVIEFDTIVYDFGKVDQGTVIVHDFIYTNKGKDDLRIPYAKGC